MFPSITNTRLPVSAKAIPRLQTAVVLPSPRCELVTTKLRGWPPLRAAARIDTAVARNDSERREDGCSSTALSTRGFPCLGLKKAGADDRQGPSPGIAPSSGNDR